MAKNVVVCCDGTGNEYGPENSNVVKLCYCLVADEGQAVYYHPGVGTMGAPNAGGLPARMWSRLCGLAFGAGLLPNVGDAYRFLMETYDEGDRLFLFGFSRGAYTARALAAILHMYGLLHRGNEGQIPYITRMFGQKTRARGRFQREIKVARGFKAAFSREVAVDFIGVWDTVSSVGWIYDPVKLPYTANNPSILVGRHAVSIDERRCFYRDNLWGKAGAHQDLRQVWFAGVHSDDGGSYLEAESGLSKITLEWMVSEAIQHGIEVNPSRRTEILGEDPAHPEYARPNPDAELHRSLHGVWWLLEFLPHRFYDWTARAENWCIPLGTPRTIPDESIIHRGVLTRMAKAGLNYHPPLPPLYRVEPGESAVESMRRRSWPALMAVLRVTLEGPAVFLALMAGAMAVLMAAHAGLPVMRTLPSPAWLHSVGHELVRLASVPSGKTALIGFSLLALVLRFLATYAALYVQPPPVRRAADAEVHGGPTNAGPMLPDFVARASAWAGLIAIPGGFVGNLFGRIDAGMLWGGLAGVVLGEVCAWYRRRAARGVKA